MPRVRSISGSTNQNTVNSGSAHAPATSPAFRPATAAKMMTVMPVTATPSKQQPGVRAAVRGGHENLKPMTPEEYPVHGDRGDQQHRRAHRTRHRGQVDIAHLVSETSKRCWNGSVSRKPVKQLHPGLHHPQLLQQAVPITVQPLRFGLPARALIPPLVVGGMIDVHSGDHRTWPTRRASR